MKIAGRVKSFQQSNTPGRVAQDTRGVAQDGRGLLAGLRLVTATTEAYSGISSAISS